LDGRAFGILLHGALSALGRDANAPRQSIKETEVLDFLDERLPAMARASAGRRSACSSNRPGNG